jgi:hypothetical protein
MRKNPQKSNICLATLLLVLLHKKEWSQKQQSIMRAHGYLNNILAAEDTSCRRGFLLICVIWQYLTQFQNL